MIWVAIVSFLISFFTFAYYYNESESEEGSDNMSVEGFLIGFYGSLIVLFISGVYIWYSILNTYIGLALVACAFILFYFFGRKIKK